MLAGKRKTRRGDVREVVNCSMMLRSQAKDRQSQVQQI
jgi:hypothetical protein